MTALRWLTRGLVVFSLAQVAGAYSVLTHEAIIDSAWDDGIKPLVLAKYPGLTPDQLIEAHANAYGGAIIQDMGYYPFGSKLFSDLTHYVRSGAFVLALLQSAENPNEYAFALGALAHYAADNNGHPEAINRAVPRLYPKLRRKYGNVVTYEENPGAHIKVEFGFDVIEVAQGHYAPKAYHDFIGFHVPKPVLEKAFEATYGVPLKSVFKDLDLALGTYRRAVSSLIPEMTKAAWVAKGDEISKATPGMTKRQFIYNLSRASFEKEWGRTYERPGLGARILAFFFRLLPKVGPFRALGFRVPDPQSETLFMASFNHTLTNYRQLVGEVRTGSLKLSDENLDTGHPVREGDYKLADRAYGELLAKLNDQHAVPPPELKQNILAFYSKAAPALNEKSRLELETLRRQ